jgi:hypothetical protein
MSAFFENIKAVAAASNRRLLNGSMRFRRSTTNFQMTSSSLSSAPNISMNDFDGIDGDGCDQDDLADFDFDVDEGTQNVEESDNDGKENEDKEDSDRDSVNMDDAPNVAEDERSMYGVKDVHFETDIPSRSAAANKTLTQRIADIVYPKIEILVKYVFQSNLCVY